MEIIKFINLFKEQLEDGNVLITPETKFKDVDGWDSLTTMLVIGMIKTDYDKDITATEINNCDTILELYNFINSK